MRTIGLSRALRGVTGLIILALLAGPAGAVSRQDALEITTSDLLGGSLEGVRLFVHPEQLPADMAVSTWRYDVFTTPAEGWFFFIDLVPGANYEHACQYVFIEAASGKLTKYDAMTPPNAYMDLEEITDGRDNPRPGESERLHAWFDQRMEEVPKPSRETRGQAYAFIISGGASQGSNHIRYWNDCSFIYKTLVNYYGYADDHIRVCISDGLDPAPDRSDNTNSPADLDGDNDPDIEYPATNLYIEQVFDELAATLTASDQLFLFTTDHGGSSGGWSTYLNLWNSETLPDYVLAGYVDALPCQTFLCCFEQCYSGGMLDDLEAEGRVLASAAAYNEYSWAMPPDYIYDEFVYYWTSAVAWEDPYGNPVDADTNDDGLVSMHEAFIYAEDHDTADETPQYYSTPPELGDIANLLGNLEGVYLALEDVTIDDDMEGESHGNGNGIIEFNETIELEILLNNMGNEDATGVTGTLSIAPGYVGISEAEASWGSIPSGETAANGRPFVFHVNRIVPDLEALEFTLDLSEEPGQMGVALTAHAPAYEVVVADIDDTVGGNGDGIANPGETLALTIAIDNVGSCDTPELDAILRGGCDEFMADETPHPIGVILSGQGVIEGGFSVEIAADSPEIFTHYLQVYLEGPDFYTRMIQIPFAVGQIFADNMEQGATAWTHYAGPGGTWGDDWHVETYRNHTPAGTTSWKCGGAGSADYGNLQYAILESAPIDLPAGSVLEFWHWMAAEISSVHTGYCYDGGLVEISTDGSTWETLTPDGGYPYLIRPGGTPGPFAAETPVWSGQHGWEYVTVDLSGYEGMVWLRWAFGSDGAVTDEGWYLDDVRVFTIPFSGTDNGAARVLRPMLYPARPNPGTQAVLRFALPQATSGNLSVFDPSARLVRILASGTLEAGEHQVTWDGRDASGIPVTTGSYFCRLSVDGEGWTRKVTILR